MFYSRTTGGFYDEAIHGAQRLSITDPAWQRPTVDVTLAPGGTLSAELDGQWRVVKNDTEEPMVVRGVPDMSVEPPTVEISNPACLIPPDAVEITADEHAELLAGQSAGKLIRPDAEGRPVLIDPPPPSLDEAVQAAYSVIDAAAGAARARYITIAPGQEATYLLKSAQARAFKEAGYAGVAPGLVQAEIDATGATAQQAADAILMQQAAWEIKAAQIESARRRGKVTVGKAAEVAAVTVARDAALLELEPL